MNCFLEFVVALIALFGQEGFENYPEPILSHMLGDRIRDLGKGAFGMWAFIAHGGLSKPTVGFQNLFRASKNMGAIFLKKKRRLRQRTHKFRASRNLGAIFLEKKGACGNVPTS